MADRGKRPVLLNPRAAKIVRRRRTADEAGFTAPNFDAGDTTPRFPKIQRRDRIGRNGKLAEVAEIGTPSSPSGPTPAPRPVKHQSSIRLENALISEMNVATDWPMSGKEKAHPSHVLRQADDPAGTNVSFPLVYDISQSMSDTGRDQTMDEDEMGNCIEDMESCQSPTDGAQFDISAIVSQLINYQRMSNGGASGRRQSIDTSAIGTAVTALSNVTVSERVKSGKTKKRPVYLLIIFASFDAEHHLKCDAYITCVNRVPAGGSERRLGIDWIMSQLIEMFEQRQAASGRFSGNQQWMIACCLVEALAQNARFLNVNAYWRNIRGLQIPPVEMLPQIASHLNLNNGIEDSVSGADLATLAMTVASQLASQSSAPARSDKTVLEFGNGLRSAISNDRLYENLALMAMMSRAACWLIEEFNRLNAHQLTAPASANRFL